MEMKMAEAQLTLESKDSSCNVEGQLPPAGSEEEPEEPEDPEEEEEEAELEPEQEQQELLSERWSPLGANYDDANSASSGVDCELEPGLEKSETRRGSAGSELARLRSIEDEQELLTSSLLALTSHFAHVQLRVRQIVEAPAEERDQLLRDLEDFAFQGIPDAAQPKEEATVKQAKQDSSEKEAGADSQLIEQLKSQLTELEQLAYEAGEPGILPQHVLLEKQKFILDELRAKLNLQVEQHELPALSTEQLRHQVDNAIGEFVGPLKMKEQLVAQLKTQITDLERFIAFLQCDADQSSVGDRLKLLSGAYNSYAAKQTARSGSQIAPPPTAPSQVGAKNSPATTAALPPSSSGGGSSSSGESLHSKAHGLLDKASLLMQMFASTHLVKPRHDDFQQNSLKKTHKGNHWGDLRAQLEVDIQEVAALAATLSCDREKLANIKRALRHQQQQQQQQESSSCPSSTNQHPSINAQNGALTTIPPRCRRAVPTGHELAPYAACGGAVSSDSDEDISYSNFEWEKEGKSRRLRGDSIATIGRELTTVVRKNFARTLQQLIQHGLRIPAESAASSLMVPFMRCLHPGPPAAVIPAAAGGDSQFMGLGRAMHAWELVLAYYRLKHGEEYNNTPARKLSQSFQLDIVDAQAVTAKQSLLSAVGMILAMHRPYKRSNNAHFKAFVCAGLNSHLLVEWLNLILSCHELVDTYYSSSSYVARTGFRDSLRSIDALSRFDFDLPVDLAIRHFRNI
ncbi:RUN domain-containing protein 1 [Drosophila kikkawai]|uniref:RUN domain-containing protein 1 n=1 Tax=Drosophila kikkawai TaxID=30033 RepID=A0A6P4J5F2_DROKI|nr:RUN domain-containing protein 1 [Drosophila kikkawai]